MKTALPTRTTTNNVVSPAKLTTSLPATTRIPVYSTRKSITTVKSRPSNFFTRPNTTTPRPPATVRTNTAQQPSDLLPPPRPPALPPMPGVRQEPHSPAHPGTFGITVPPTRRLIPNKMFTIPDSNGSDKSRPLDPEKKFVIDEKPAARAEQSGSSVCTDCKTGTKSAPSLVGIFTIPARQPQWVIELPVEQSSRNTPGQWTVQVPGKGYTGQWLDISPARAPPRQGFLPPESHQQTPGVGRRGPQQWTVQVADTRFLGHRPGGGQWAGMTPRQWEVQMPNTGSGQETRGMAPAGRELGQWVLSAGSAGNRDRVTGQWVVEVPMGAGAPAWHMNRASVSVTPGWVPVSVTTMGLTSPGQHVPAPRLQVPMSSGRRTRRQAPQSKAQTTGSLSPLWILKQLQDPDQTRSPSSGHQEAEPQVPAVTGANEGKYIISTPHGSKQWSISVPLNEHNRNRPYLNKQGQGFNRTGNLSGTLSNGRRRREADDWVENSDDEEGEGSSLVFVFDTTGSMSNELNQVKRQAKELALTMIRHPKKPIHNYIFVPFNDPVVGPPTVTRDPDEFQDIVDGVRVIGGGDCMEMSLRAIRTALRLARPKSFIYVFTDAGSKEKFLVDDILDLIQKKGSLVMVLLTGHCESEDYFLYSNITVPSHGSVIDLDKSDISQVLDYIEKYIERNRVSLMNVNSAQGGPERPFPLAIDSSITTVEVSVSGKKSTLNVLDPEGKKAVPPQLEHTLNLTNIKAVKIKDPEPGVWTVKAGSESPYNVRSSAVSSSNFSFNYGFSVIPTSKMSETAHRPLSGRENSLLITSSVASSLCNLTEVRLLDLDGRVLAVLPLKEIDGRAGVYSAGAVSPPNSFFNIEIQGFDESGHLVKRIFSSAIKPQLPNLPSISGRSEVSARSGGRAVLECRVESLVPVSVSWYKDGHHLATHLYNQSSKSVYEIDEIGRDSRGSYSCVASNLAGNTTKHINVIIADPPKIQVVPRIGGDVGSDVWLPCFISSSLAANLSWFRMTPSSTPKDFDEKIKNGYTEGGDNVNFGYMIEGTTVKDAGLYACVAENRVGREKGVVDMRVAAQPEVEPPTPVHHKAGSDQLVLRCRLGRPDYSVSVQWSKQGRPITKNHTIIDGTEENGYEHQLIIYNPTEDDEGLYQCAASNHIGSSEGTVAVIWIVEPKVQPVAHEVLVEGGGSAILTCIVHEGKPQPSISWYREYAQITIDTYKYKMMVNGSLVVEEVGPDDGGLYQCTAENEAGADSAWLTLTIGHRPRIRPINNRQAVRWGGAVEVDCWAEGEPTPSVSWHRHGSVLTSASEHATLSLSDIKMNNSGVYTCVAENSHGKEEAEISVVITDLEEPKILKGVGGVEILKALPGQRVELRCVAHGTPPPEYIWYKDNLQLGYLFKNYQIMNGSLVIPVMSYRHVGEYKCVAKNPLGEDSKLFSIQNYEAPKISMNFGSYITGLVGSNASLPCHATGDPPPVVSWTRDSQQDHYIKLNRGQKSSDSNHLHIYNITEEDAGRYICKAENIAGVARRALVLSVLSPPKIVSLASESTALSGDVVFLSCNARGIPRPSVSWLKNGLPLQDFKGSLGNNYIRFFAELEDSGNYTCVAKNKHGEAQSTTLLTVLEPPRIGDSLPGRMEGIVGQPLELPCSVSGSPKPVVAWHYRGQTLHKAIDNYENSVPLKIDKLGPRDGGYYMCVASNKAGSARRSVEVIVLVPPEIAGWEEEIRALPGDTVAVECRAHGSPRPTLAWYKDGNTLPHEFFVSDGTLRFIAETTHSSNYTCVATNKAGTDQRNLFINIYEVPQFPDGQNEELEVIKGESVDFKCSAVGDPVPQLTWFHDGRLLQPTKRVFVKPGNDGVVIRRATEADEGIYECTATNKAGSATRRIKLSVLVRPSVKGWPAVTSQKEGEEIVLRCEARGRPAPSISWYKDNQPLTAKGHILRFIATSSESGNYSCVATNKAGENSTSTRIQVKVPAQIHAPLEESLVVQLNERVELMCEAQGLPEPTITWFYNKTTINQSHPEFQIRKGKLLIDFVKVKHSGDYLCVAGNEIGRAQKVFSVTVHVAPRITDDGNELISLKEGDDYSISCSAYGIPAPDIFWIKEDKMFKKGYYEDHYIVLEDNTLIISDAQENMQGVHTCLATNVEGSATKNYNVQVTVPLWYGYSNEDNATLVEIEESDTGVLTCPLVDVSDVQWLQNGESVDLRPNTRADDVHIELGDGGRSLTITEAFPSDSGLYECLAGGERAAFRVEVLVSPHLLDEFPHPGPYRLTEGDSLTLNCSASGNPPPKIRWREVERGLPVTRHTLPGVLVKGANREVLHWPSVRGHHSGRYSCTATNRAGTEARLFHIMVTESPKVDGPTEVKLSANIGDTVVMNCSLTGNPKPKLSWKHVSFNGREKPLSSSALSLDQDKAVLKIESQQDSGYYLCNGTNPIGSVTKTFVLDVLEGPAVEGEEELVRQAEGSEATLVCRGCGRPTPDVSWSRGDWLLAPSQGSVSTESTPGLVTSTLTIPHLQQKDEASYICTLSNHLGSARKVFQLKVIVAPVLSDSSSTSEAKEVEVVEGRVARLECPVVDTGNVQVRWEVRRGDKGLAGEQGSTGDNRGLASEGGSTRDKHLDGKASSDDDKGLAGVGASLVLSSVSLRDLGLYTCTASNEAGAAQASFKLTVLVPPKFDATEFEDRMKVLLEGEAVFNCSIHSKPSSVITWLKGSRIIEDDKHYKLIDNNQTLIISDTNYTDSGTYTCIASNTAGSAERNFDLQVHGAPSVGVGSSEEVTTTELYIKRFRRAVLRCPLTGSPPPAIHWYKNEKLLESDEMNVFILSEGRKMFIMRAMEPDAGRYHCLAENSAGVHKLEFTLKIIVGEEWSDWSDWGGCWPSCGGGTRARRRRCGEPHLLFSPFISYDNTSCQGPSVQTAPCNQHPCPVDGVWGEWSGWSECSASCGEGRRSRERQCEGPSWGGEPCRGGATMEEACSIPPCPTHGTWSEWSEWSDCTVSCRGGLRFRERRCDGTTHGGIPCQGNSRDIVPCNNHPCPVDGRWSAWGGWGSCSASCGPGKRARHRYCYRSRYNGKPCSGPKKQVEDCFNRECTQHGRFRPEIGSLRYRPHRNRHSYYSTLMPQADGRSGDISREHSGIQYATGVESFVRAEDLVAAEEKSKEPHDTTITDAVILIDSPDEVADAPVSRKEDGTIQAMSTRTTKVTRYIDSPDNISAGSSPRIQKLNIYDRFCPPGFKRTSSKNNCADVDECKIKRYNKCHTSREICRNLIGSYSCICASGYEARGSRCRDVDECELGISKCSHYCHNSPGSYKCSCPDGLILLNDNSTCHTDEHDYQSDSYEDSASQDYETMDYITSNEDSDQDEDTELINPVTSSEETLVCPKGFIRENNACKDVNECEEGIDWCTAEQLCINSRGSYRCLDTPCPPNYDLEPKIKSCVMMCSEEGKQCGGGAAVMEVVSYLSVDTTLSNLTVMQELLHLTAYDETLRPLLTTNFTIEKNDYQLPVDIREEEDGSGTLYAIDELHIKKMLRMTLVATTYREDGQIVYITQYYVFIYNSAYEIS